MAVRGPVKNSKPSIRFESVKLDSLFEVLDAVAWLPSPSAKEIAQFANIDPRTGGKILKNARLIGLVETPEDQTFVLSAPYPYKGALLQKESVVREALLRLPLIQDIKQFLGLGNDLQTSMRKAATVAGERNYDVTSIAPLVTSQIGSTPSTLGCVWKRSSIQPSRQRSSGTQKRPAPEWRLLATVPETSLSSDNSPPILWRQAFKFGLMNSAFT